MNPSMLATILGVCLAAMIGFCTWIAVTLISIKVVVCGYDGKNGLNSRVRAVEHVVFPHRRYDDDDLGEAGI
jgi:hypothetical protein